MGSRSGAANQVIFTTDISSAVSSTVCQIEYGPGEASPLVQ